MTLHREEAQTGNRYVRTMSFGVSVIACDHRGAQGGCRAGYLIGMGEGDDLPSLAATLTCARCAPGATGRPCAEHLRKRLAVIRNSARRDFGLRYYAQRLARVAANGRDQTLDDSDEIVRGTVSLREVL